MEFNLADLWELVAAAIPDREALVCGERRLTFGQLDDQATRAAHVLADLGVAAGDHVGLFLFNGTEFLECMLGCFKLRAVPLNFNYRYQAGELAGVLRDSHTVAIVTDAELVTVAAEAVTLAGTPSPGMVLETGPGYDTALAAASARHDFGPRSAGDHYILYTGGTTGAPKGVVWRHDDIFFAALGAGNPGGPPIECPEDIARTARESRGQRVRPYLAAGDPGPDEFVAMALGPLMHAGGQWLALGTLLGGGRCVLYADRHFDPRRVLELIERERLTMISVVGDATARPLVELAEREPATHDTASLLMIGSGGAMLSAPIKRRLLDAFPSVLVILEAIGSSEAPVQAVAVATPDADPGTTLRFAGREQTMIVDDALRPVGSGTPGRLATRGRVPLGYYNDPDRSDRTFVTIDGARWSLPGDMAVQHPDGTIELLGRGSLCINTGGEKVYPEEVEAVVKTCPGVADAVVVGVRDERWGEQVVAVVATDPSGPAPTLDAVVRHCRPQLAGYKLPRHLHLVDAIERSPAGKPDYEWARAVAAGTPTASSGMSSSQAP